MLKDATRPSAPTASRAGDATSLTPGARRGRRKFLRLFPEGFRDPTYLAWERDYKWSAHRQWQASLGREAFHRLLREREYGEIARIAATIEARTNLLFSFEKMALRDALKTADGARLFAAGLYAFLYGDEAPDARFRAWRDTVSRLPRRLTRVLTWPTLTVFPFIAQPAAHLYLKPLVTRRAAAAYGFPFEYASKPDWPTYRSLLDFGRTVRRDLADLRPRDQIDIQSFIWVLGSEEYD